MAGALNGKVHGSKHLTHFPALKESFYSLWLNCCHISLTATGRWKPSVMFSAPCRLIIVGRCAWSRWSNWTRCPHFVPWGETTEGFGRCFTFLVAISLLTDSTKQPAGGRVVGRIATLVPTAPIAPIPAPDTRPCTGSRVPVETAADLGELMAPQPAPPPLPRRTLTPGSIKLLSVPPI